MLSRNQTELVDYAYVGSRTARRSYNTAARVDADYGYDDLGRLTGIDAGTGLARFTYMYEPDENNIDKMYFHHHGSTVYNNYDYDDLDRLTRADYLVNELTNVYEAFVMDALGNRESTTLRGGSTDTYSVDTLTNRYNSIDSASLDYDDAGNTTQDKDGYQYVYDYENRVVKIVDEQERLIAKFDYDTQGRRIRVYDAVADTTTLYYYSDNWQVLSEYDGSGTQQAYYVYGNYIDEVLLMRRNASDKYYLHDHLYSSAALLDASGDAAERYEYDAYGTAHIMDASYNPRSVSAYGNPYTFTGRRLDVLDGGNLTRMHYRHRDYDTYAGRFVQQDPLGVQPTGSKENPFYQLLQYMDGLSSYKYGKANPTSASDASGLWGADIHATRTAQLALFRTFMRPRHAATVGAHDLAVDSIHSPITTDRGELGWHFDTEGITELNPTWGPTDSRFIHAEEELQAGIDACLNHGPNIDDTVAAALERLGYALHPVQDWYAHGTWKPWPTFWHWYPWHPAGSDNPALDFDPRVGGIPVPVPGAGPVTDGILRDWDLYNGPPSWWSWDWFHPGMRRIDGTVERTTLYLQRFRNGVRDTPCFCRIYMF